MCYSQLIGECLAAFVRTGPGSAGQVGQGPGDLDDLVRGAGADLPEIDGSADGGDGFGGGRPGAAQLSGRDVAVGLPGGVPQPAAGED